MPPASARPLQPSHDQRRALLSRHFVEVAEPMLEAGESYADLSVERLIKAVDVSRSTFYVYFADKGELVTGRSSARSPRRPPTTPACASATTASWTPR